MGRTLQILEKKMNSSWIASNLLKWSGDCRMSSIWSKIESTVNNLSKFVKLVLLVNFGYSKIRSTSHRRVAEWKKAFLVLYQLKWKYRNKSYIKTLTSEISMCKYQWTHIFLFSNILRTSIINFSNYRVLCPKVIVTMTWILANGSFPVTEIKWLAL